MANTKNNQITSPIDFNQLLEFGAITLKEKRSMIWIESFSNKAPTKPSRISKLALSFNSPIKPN